MEQELPLLVVATRNAHKTGEIRAMLAGKWEVKDLSDYPQAPPVDETGVTFTENATLKALSASKCIPGVLLADDSGLEVDVLDGRPGVWSSSFGGEEGNHARNNLRMMEELRRAGVKPGDRPSARFRCVMVLAGNGRVLAEFSGQLLLGVGVDIAEDGAAVFFVADSNSFQRPSSRLRAMPRRTVCSLPLCFYLRGFIFD